MAGEGPPSVEAVEEGLKDFQRATVEFVFSRLYGRPDPTRRFLIADEVGLGKTLVARGVIARTVRHLWQTTPRIDVVYICSNQDIARQNVNRLSIGRESEFVRTSRITLLPIQISGFRRNKLNFVSITPGTSFQLRSSLGRKKERALLYWLLKDVWKLEGAGPLNVLQGNVQDWRKFRRYVHKFLKRYTIDQDLRERFVARLEADAARAEPDSNPALRARFEEACRRFPRARDPSNVPAKDRRYRRELVGDLRALLAETCVEALEPDLIILDEFQRFKGLLTGDDPASELADQLFAFTDPDTGIDARVLLLSATPYKMYTLSDETDEDHYRDFLATLEFLYPDDGPTREVAGLLQDYRRELYRLGEERNDQLGRIKRALETRLRSVMVRSERLGVSADRGGMLCEVTCEGTRLEASDVEAYLDLQKIARPLGHRDPLGYWKSASYLLSFMEGYKLKKSLRGALEPSADAPLTAEQSKLQETLAGIVSRRNTLCLPWEDIKAYEKVEPGNARLRALLDDPVGKEGWRLLWMPPALPYYDPGSPFAGAPARNLTKRLVFSAWRVVPRLIGTLLSYEAERQIFCSFEDSPENTRQARKARRGLLRFTRGDGRLTGMPVLALLYPSLVLAELSDPLELVPELRAGDSDGIARRENLLCAVTRRLEEVLPDVLEFADRSKPEDEAWYWAAPLLLDRKRRPQLTEEWFGRGDLGERWAAESNAADEEPGELWGEHVERARELLAGGVELGSPPSDLAEVLAHLGLAGPAVCSFRALGRLARRDAYLAEPALRDEAARTAWEFRNLFNLPESMAIIRGLDDREPYWRRALEYSFAGNLQAVLDEYGHFLHESLGHTGGCDLEAVGEIAAEIRSALSLRTVSLAADAVRVSDSPISVTLSQQRLRTHYALRFGDESGFEEEAGARASHVRTAFNSPFWPFILATTSVGQEGLDFHAYCHAVVHWNLPSNPVDLEQREGRVHRYKGHAIRKNVAARHGPEVLNGDANRARTESPDARGAEDSAKEADEVHGKASGPSGPVTSDPWKDLFRAAAREREPDRSELVPYWIYEVEDGARIERHVPALPLTREQIRMQALRRSLAVYRMAFGQPRQEDLVEFLLDYMETDPIQTMLNELRIDLSPPPKTDS